MTVEQDGNDVRVARPARTPEPWQPAPASLILSSETVHVWRAELNVAGSEIRRLYTSLSEDERERAATIVFDRVRSRFIVSRGVLRGILSSYLGEPPGELRFGYGEFGKPAVTARRGHRQSPICFNVSHTQDILLVAVATRDIGVDIERVEHRCVQNSIQIAEQHFSAEDLAFLVQMPGYLRQKSFLALWTRKEAVAKAVGRGLSLSLDRIPVLPLTAADSVEFVTVVRGADDGRRWTVMTLNPGPGYVGALAVVGSNLRIVRWQWTESPADQTT